MRITKSFVDKTIPPKPKSDKVSIQDFYRDTAIPGFALRVTSGGAKSFIVEKRVNGRVKRITLGVLSITVRLMSKQRNRNYQNSLRLALIVLKTKFFGAKPYYPLSSESPNSITPQADTLAFCPPD